MRERDFAIRIADLVKVIRDPTDEMNRKHCCGADASWRKQAEQFADKFCRNVLFPTMRTLHGVATPLGVLNTDWGAKQFLCDSMLFGEIIVTVECMDTLLLLEIHHGGNRIAHEHVPDLDEPDVSDRLKRLLENTLVEIIRRKASTYANYDPQTERHGEPPEALLDTESEPTATLFSRTHNSIHVLKHANDMESKGEGIAAAQKAMTWAAVDAILSRVVEPIMCELAHSLPPNSFLEIDDDKRSAALESALVPEIAVRGWTDGLDFKLILSVAESDRSESPLIVESDPETTARVKHWLIGALGLELDQLATDAERRRIHGAGA